jgi:hypothetical protein
MGWLKAVGSWFVGTHGEKNADLARDTVRGVGTWIDERDFTDEEKSKANLELAVKYAQYADQTLQENTVRSKTRRSLSLMIIRVEGFILLLSAATFRASPEWSEYLYKIATESPWALLTLGVGAFFFGTHLLRTYK